MLYVCDMYASVCVCAKCPHVCACVGERGGRREKLSVCAGWKVRLITLPLAQVKILPFLDKSTTAACTYMWLECVLAIVCVCVLKRECENEREGDR